MALLVALISVLSFAIPAIKNSLTAENSVLHVNYSFVYGGHIMMIVSNSGTKPGHIINGLISYNNGAQKNINVQVVGVAAGENYIAQGSSKEFQLFIDDDGKREIQNDLRNLNNLSEIILLVNVINFNGKRETYKYKLEKADFVKLNEAE
ncbi:hypothetical protein [Segetibacter aerophilus]|uniref:hypothetical protein n=1 Tax=Segetibacter aerophilus TaxID=670293 RepID=UPI0011BFC029|nr:hypothetical protein [Segetibacter aerophilus]